MKKAVFWVVAPCSLVHTDRRFRGAYCLHDQDDESSDDESGKLLRNVGQFLPDYTMQHPRRQPSSFYISFSTVAKELKEEAADNGPFQFGSAVILSWGRGVTAL
jgi:hypothetical protein